MNPSPTLQLKRELKKSVQLVARSSYVVKGVLFCSIAIIAVRTAIGLSHLEPDRQQVLEHLFYQPFGQLLLGVVVIALAGHTIWRLLETFSDPYRKGTSPGGLLHRFTYLLSGISYGSLVITGGKLLFDQRSGAGDTRQIWAARLLRWDGGQWLVVLIGLAMLGWAFVQGKKALTNDLYDCLQTQHVAPVWVKLFRLAGRIGFLTYAGLLAGIGWYTLRAAFTQNPQLIKSMDDLLLMIQHFPYGTQGLFVVAGGIFLFGLFMFVMARYFPVKLD